MQETSEAFEAAVTSHRTWVPVRLRTDWAGDGYDGDGSIDDLSMQTQQEWSVDHSYDDGLPETVAFVSGMSVPEFETALTGRPDPDTGAPITTPAYWSPLRTDSPVHGYERDVAPITLDVGLITESGPEFVRVFTGQMVNVALRSGEAQLSTISETRLKLMKLVQPPAFSASLGAGLYATWPVSWCLTQCGIYAGPQPREGYTAWYVPMHGSAWEMIPSTNRVYTAAELLDGGDFPTWITYEQTQADAIPNLTNGNIGWIEGPYITAPDVQLRTDLRTALYMQELAFDPAASDPFSQAGNAARLEMWVKGDVTDVNTAPGGSGTVTRLCSLWGETSAGPYFRLGVTPTRNVQVSVYDGSVTRTLTSTGTLPTDGAWYFVGAAYDMTADKLWVNLNGTVESSSASMSTANLPVQNQPTADTTYWTSGNPVFITALPCAEITLSTGAQANVDSYPLWRSDTSFAPTATLHPSKVRLNGVIESEPREAWQIIADYAGAELASVRLTESDQFEFLPLSWWVRDEQQVVTEAFDTAVNAAAFDVDLDPTKVRNSVKVTFTEIGVLGYDINLSGFQRLYELQQGTSDPVSIPPGTTVLRLTYSNAGVMPQQRIWLLDNTQIVGWFGSGITLNREADGTGAYAADGQVTITVDSWESTSITVRFVNHEAYTWYIANDVDEPPLIIVGLPVTEVSTYVTDSDDTSVALRGERALDVTAPGIQTVEAARRLARNLKTSLRYPVATIGTDGQGIEATANPARQPGDLVTFRDRETGVDGTSWRLRTVKHKGQGADYTQAIVARRAHPIMIIGQGRVGESLIGPPQD